MKKIIFILSAIDAVHAIKRINEFIDNGYKVEVYGFTRDVNSTISVESVTNQKFKVNILGGFSNDVPYFKRLPILYKGFKKVIRKVKHNEILYVFGLDLAIFLKLFGRKTYIYEEADLTYTYLKNKFIRRILKKLDKNIILNSFETVLTSEGFVDYLFGNDSFLSRPANISIIPNKLNANIKNYHTKKIDRSETNLKNIRFGFVGSIRFITIYNFVKVIAERFPQHEVLLHGIISPNYKDKFEKLIENYPNVHYKGKFQNPIDLPSIYSNIDISIGTYDVTSDNVKYAEPNKLYESIYFGVPIVVTSDTFLNKKVSELGIGFGINALQEESIWSFIKSIDKNQYKMWLKNIEAIDKNECINLNPSFFKKIDKKLNKLK